MGIYSTVSPPAVTPIVTPVTVPNGGTGRSTLTAHAVLIGEGTSPVGFAGPTATVGQVLQSAGLSADPAFSTAAYPLTTTINQLLYSSAANTVTGLATANNGVLSTSSAGVPSIDITNFAVLSTGLQLKGNNTNTAPPAGFIGEIITSSAIAVAMANGVDTDITSISLTAGIWDIEGSLAVLPTDGTGVGTQEWVQITTTSATISGNAGIDHNRAVFTAFNLFSLNAPKVRATLNATTTYYLVGTHNYTSVTGPGNGIISATRVG